MKARLYVVHGSHPCATVERALRLKGIAYRTVELPPAMHAPIQRVLFGQRTVSGLRLDGERVSGSRAILARLEQLKPEPPLFPRDPEARARVERAERWGDDTFQPVARRVLWFALRRDPQAALSYSEHSKLPMPAPVVRASMPLIARAEFALNRVTEDAVRADLEALPGYLDTIDRWIADRVIGAEAPNAADLQVASTLRLLLTVEDLRPLIESRPSGRLALRLFPEWDGRIPAGTLPTAPAAVPAA